jgi:two-component system cell cycle sensor histidine kinase/response regulator CckA
MKDLDARSKPVVLVIDDEAVIRDVLQTALPCGGFDVVLASTGKQSLEIFLRRQDVIAAVLLDVRMPEMNGVEVFRRLREIDQQVPICFMTGYSADEIRSELSGLSEVTVLRKPFSLANLFEILHELTQARLALAGV